MIIESNIVNKEILSALLEKTGIPIDFAENPERAVSLFNENPEKYHLVFIDDKIPGLKEAAESIRAIECDWAKKVPIIAMLTNPSKENIDSYLAAGMNDHIEKPFDPDDICIMIKKRAIFFHDGLEPKQDLEYGIAWNDSFKLGDETVDEQHFQIFELVSALVSACADELSTKMLKGIFDFLVNFTAEHFDDEEALMLRNNYPEIKKHKQLHIEFKESVDKLSAKFEKSGSSKELSDNLVKIVVRWLVNHIMQEDKKIVTHIRSVTTEN
jgi:hemerythrin-like metal-binding protein